MAVTNAYASLAQVKAIAQLKQADDDIIVELAINASSRAIDAYCGWRFWQDATVIARTFDATSSGCLYLADSEAGDGISTTTGLIVKLDVDEDGTFETTLTISTDFVLGPLNAAARYPVWPFTEIRSTGNYSFSGSSSNRPTVQVTAKWGFPVVPDDVTAACVLLSRDFYKEMKSAPFGVADFGGDGPLRIGTNRTARMLLDAYRKPAVG